MEMGLLLAVQLNKLENCPKLAFPAESRAVNVRSLCQIQCRIPILQMWDKHLLNMVYLHITLRLLLPMLFLLLNIDRQP